MKDYTIVEKIDRLLDGTERILEGLREVIDNISENGNKELEKLQKATIKLTQKEI